MKYFLFLLFFVFISCDNVHRTERKVLENGKIEKSGDSFKFTCEKNYKLCRKDDDKYTCTNINNTIEKKNKKTKFKCFSLTDPETCLDGNPCHVPNRKSDFYKDLTDEEFDQRVKDSLDITCNADYDSGNNSKGEDKSTCRYKCHIDETHEFADCNGDIDKLNTASEGDGCEADLRNEALHFNGCYCEGDSCGLECTRYYCSNNGDFSKGCTVDIKSPDLHLSACQRCEYKYCNVNDDWSDGCEFDHTIDKLHLNHCPDEKTKKLSCKGTWCDVNGDWSDGCEFDYSKPELHFGACPKKNSIECSIGFCDMDRDPKNGCEFDSTPVDLHLNSCHSCSKSNKPGIRYVNTDGDWSNGCEEATVINRIDSCGDEGEQLNCVDILNSDDTLTSEEKKLYNPTCTKDENGKYQCGKRCNAQKCGDNCCALDQVCSKDKKCGCTIGHVKSGCTERLDHGSLVGTVEVCKKDDGYVTEDCALNASCNGNKCGECLNGSSRCIYNKAHTGEYNKGFNIRQRCVNGTWSDTMKRTDCRDCRVYICYLPDEV